MDGWMHGRWWGRASVWTHLIVVGRELIEQLFDPVFLPWAVHVGHLVLRQGAVVLMNLRERQRTFGLRGCFHYQVSAQIFCSK